MHRRRYSHARYSSLERTAATFGVLLGLAEFGAGGLLLLLAAALIAWGLNAINQYFHPEKRSAPDGQ